MQAEADGFTGAIWTFERGWNWSYERFEVSVGDVRVDLRRRNVRVAEHLLDRADIGTILDQMRRERMPQRVRRNALKPAFFGVFADKLVDDLAVHRPPERRDEQVLDLDIFFSAAKDEIAF